MFNKSKNEKLNSSGNVFTYFPHSEEFSFLVVKLQVERLHQRKYTTVSEKLVKKMRT